MKKRVVIVGGVACGTKTAARLRRLDPDAEITIVEKGNHLSYAGCGLPYFLEGVVKDSRDLLSTPIGVPRDSAFFRTVKQVDVLQRHMATRIDREKRVLTVLELDTGVEKHLPYDTLVLATGASSIRPNLPGTDLARVFTLGTLDDALAMKDSLQNGTGKKAVVIGGGLIGLEVVEALVANGYGVSIVELLETPLATLFDRDFGHLLKKLLAQHQVAFFGGERVLELLGDAAGNVAAVRTDMREIPADLVLLAVGVRPNVEIAREAGLDIGPTGGIVTDERMRTSDPHILAGGDCVETTHFLTGKRVRQPMGSAANRQGRVIADTIAGHDSKFNGVLGTAIMKAFDWMAGRTGLNETAAIEAGFSPVAVTVTAPDLPHFMPNAAPLYIRLVADRTSRRVLGAQIMGPGKGDKRLDTLVSAITGHLTVDDLADLDLGYAPPFSTALDPVTHAANVLRNKMDGLLVSYNPSELLAKASRGDRFLLLDVRTPEEVATQGKLPFDSQTNIPLGALWKRAGELPRDMEIIALCKISVRGWDAYSILKGLGFSNVALLEGGILAWPYELRKAA
jgi:NADPH-dependent 2,4-dienoyl-CoA reductase/sulfur reductase-like enzyme/rhodanese-related sulfurtransferase